MVHCDYASVVGGGGDGVRLRLDGVRWKATGDRCGGVGSGGAAGERGAAGGRAGVRRDTGWWWGVARRRSAGGTGKGMRSVRWWPVFLKLTGAIFYIGEGKREGFQLDNGANRGLENRESSKDRNTHNSEKKVTFSHPRELY